MADDKKLATISDLPQELTDKIIEPLLPTQIETDPLNTRGSTDWEKFKTILDLRRVSKKLRASIDEHLKNLEKNKIPLIVKFDLSRDLPDVEIIEKAKKFGPGMRPIVSFCNKILILDLDLGPQPRFRTPNHSGKERLFFECRDEDWVLNKIEWIETGHEEPRTHFIDLGNGMRNGRAQTIEGDMKEMMLQLAKKESRFHHFVLVLVGPLELGLKPLRD